MEERLLTKIETFTHEKVDIEIKIICQILIGNDIKKEDTVVYTANDPRSSL